MTLIFVMKFLSEKSVIDRFIEKRLKKLWNIHLNNYTKIFNLLKRAKKYNEPKCILLYIQF